MAQEPEAEIVHRELDTTAAEPAVEIAEAVADIEAKDATHLPPVYDCVDGVLDAIVSNPPAETAQMRVTFTYETYRVTIEQDGHAKFVKIE